MVKYKTLADRKNNKKDSHKSIDVDHRRVKCRKSGKCFFIKSTARKAASKKAMNTSTGPGSKK